MESLINPQKLFAAARKYRYAISILLLGLVLMLLPSGKNLTDTQVSEPKATDVLVVPDLEQQLEHLLAQIQGAGQVSILLTQRNGSETHYQNNEQTKEDDTSASRSSSVVITEDKDHSENALVRRIDPPIYMGAVIVCQGADDPRVKLAIVDAVRCATGLGADQISVIKMK